MYKVPNKLYKVPNKLYKVPNKLKHLTKKQSKKLLEGYRRCKQDMRHFANSQKIKCSDNLWRRFFRSKFPAEYEEIVENNKCNNKKYARGRNFEYKVRDDKKNNGYFVLRSPQSKGIADLIALKNGKSEFIQCKLNKYHFREKEREKLIQDAKEYGAKAILAYRNEKRMNWKPYQIIYEEIK